MRALLCSDAGQARSFHFRISRVNGDASPLRRIVARCGFGHIGAMQTLIEMLAGLIALLAAAALSQFGVDLNAPQKPDREIQRVRECADSTPATKVHVTAPASC
jgi:hypothetical protein